MALMLLRGASRAAFYRHSVSTVLRTAPISMNAKAVEEQKKYWEKNEVTMNRPLSPHMTIYNFGLTSTLSILNRTTGVFLSAGVYMIPAMMVFASGDFTSYAMLLKSLPMSSALIFSIKMSVAWPLVYHTLAGFRHMAWDLGYGFKIKQVYTSGYVLVGLSILGSLGLALL